jgi:predicted nucleic acid-binding protein
MSLFILDANIISYYIRNDEKVIANIEKAMMAGHDIKIAPIAWYEVLRGLLLLGSAKKLEQFGRFCQMFPVGELDNRVLSIAADVYVAQRRKGLVVDDADILIAACCLQSGAILVTHNTKHFAHIDGLTVSDWTDDASVIS